MRYPDDGYATIAFYNSLTVISIGAKCPLL